MKRIYADWFSVKEKIRANPFPPCNPRNPFNICEIVFQSVKSVS